MCISLYLFIFYYQDGINENTAVNATYEDHVSAESRDMTKIHGCMP